MSPQCPSLENTADGTGVIYIVFGRKRAKDC